MYIYIYMKMYMYMYKIGVCTTTTSMMTTMTSLPGCHLARGPLALGRSTSCMGRLGTVAERGVADEPERRNSCHPFVRKNTSACALLL